MDSQNISSYQSLFNEDSEQINSLPNEVIVSDPYNNITSTRDINNFIDDQTISPNKIDFSQIITQQITTNNRIFNTSFSLVPSNASEYVTKFYADQKGGTAGSLSVLFPPPYLGSGTISIQNNWYLLINNVYDVSYYISGKFSTTGTNNVLPFGDYLKQAWTNMLFDREDK